MAIVPIVQLRKPRCWQLEKLAGDPGQRAEEPEVLGLSDFSHQFQAPVSIRCPASRTNLVCSLPGSPPQVALALGHGSCPQGRAHNSLPPQQPKERGPGPGHCPAVWLLQRLRPLSLCFQLCKASRLSGATVVAGWGEGLWGPGWEAPVGPGQAREGSQSCHSSNCYQGLV